ncbi:MAG: hypothetical protein GXO88_07965 [Chlorobi bacterium]|nr:hypothetical protein [Chlorobiota bacterium]
MKKLLLLSVIASMFMFGCKKTETPPTSTGEDVVFASAEMPIGGLKAGREISENLSVQYASATIDGTTYTPEVFYLNNIAYTQAVKLEVGVHTLSQFLLMNDNDTPNDTSDDIIVKATPLAGSEYASFVSSPLSSSFTVEAFKKAEVSIEVLNFEETTYTSFGFTWFQPVDVTVREQLFFGDICTKHPDDYTGSLYEQQENGLQIDMPAIFKVEVYKNGVLQDTYDNEYDADGNLWLGEGAPMHVKYSDSDNDVDNFELKLYIYVAEGNTFGYKYFHSWTFSDDQMIDNGSDGVVDFALGTCHADEADLSLPPYINLPATLNYTITAVPGTLGTYFDANIQGVGPGYEISNGLWPTYCGDYQTFISVGNTYAMDVYSSLYPDLIPPGYSTDDYDLVNWLMNNLDNYPGYDWTDVQAFLWKVLNNWDGSNVAYVGTWAQHPIAQQMFADAQANGEGYLPLPGGWAAILLVGDTIQLQLVLIDP